MFDKNQNRFKDMPIFKTIDEWLIWLDLYKGISPDFEETHIHSWNKVDDFIIKTVDLRTKNVLYDSSETTICKLKEAQIYKHIRNVLSYSSS